MRAARHLAAAALCAALLAGCASTGAPPQPEPSAQQHAQRADFIESHSDLTDQQLATLCPGLYPDDFLSDPDKYGVKTDKDADLTFSARDRAQATAAGCKIGR